MNCYEIQRNLRDSYLEIIPGIIMCFLSHSILTFSQSDYCWNPAPVSVKGTRYKLCFAKATEGGHGLSIQNGKVVADNAVSKGQIPGLNTSYSVTQTQVQKFNFS